MDCFAAYAAHELRGEITLQLTVAGVALADRDADSAALRRMGEEIIACCKRQERLLEALLTLARSECAQLRRERIDLAETAANVLQDHDRQPLRQVTTFEPAVTVGNPDLVKRLIANLVENAVRYNAPGGRLDLATYTTADRAMLTIANSGPVIPPGELDRLFLPFQRLPNPKGGRADGAGLGLAIVQAIAEAHGATINARPKREGGLRIAVGFPGT